MNRSRTRSTPERQQPNNKVKRPELIAPDGYDPKPDWLDSLTTAGGWANLDNVGTHYYSKNRDQLSNLVSMGNKARAHSKPLWDTEFHWNVNDCAGDDPNCTQWGEWLTSVKGFLAAADNFDNDVQHMTWWSYKAPCPAGVTDSSWCDTGVRAALQTAVVESTRNKTPLDPPTDGDGGHSGHLRYMDCRPPLYLGPGQSDRSRSRCHPKGSRDAATTSFDLPVWTRRAPFGRRHVHRSRRSWPRRHASATDRSGGLCSQRAIRGRRVAVAC